MFAGGGRVGYHPFVPSSPTSRTLQECRKRGWTSAVVEKWIPQTKRRLDLFGCIDIVALDGQPGVLGIQATSGGNHSSRVSKALEEPRLQEWLRAGNRFAVWSWSKKGPAGTRKKWTLREQELLQKVDG